MVVEASVDCLNSFTTNSVVVENGEVSRNDEVFYFLEGFCRRSCDVY